jgi:MoxR-like ATPase
VAASVAKSKINEGFDAIHQLGSRVKTRFDRERPEQLETLVTDWGPDKFLGRNYEADEDLEAAVNVALILSRPLLVSGAPGCGKTQLGYAVARNLGIERVYSFSVKSTSEARDLFYGYDAIGRFQAVQIAAAERPFSDGGPSAASPPKVGDYIEYRALGAAILDAHPKEDVSHLLVGRYRHPGRPRRSVVVIDEIDKAPRDFPNDLLDEVDRMKFRVPELLQWARTNDRSPETPGKEELPFDARPIVVITSNSEKQLPDPFLRRCVFAELGFPADDEKGREKLDRIVSTALEQTIPGQAQTIAEAVRKLVFEYRRRNLVRRPGIAELLDAAHVVAEARETEPGRPLEDLLRLTRPSLVKEAQDGKYFDDAVKDATLRKE